MNKIKLKTYALYLRREKLTQQERELVENELRASKINRDMLLRVSFLLQDNGIHIIKSDYGLVERFIDNMECSIACENKDFKMSVC